MFGIYRLIGNLCGMLYVSVHGDKLYIDNISNHIALTEYYCIIA